MMVYNYILLIIIIIIKLIECNETCAFFILLIYACSQVKYYDVISGLNKIIYKLLNKRFCLLLLLF